VTIYLFSISNNIIRRLSSWKKYGSKKIETEPMELYSMTYATSDGRVGSASIRQSYLRFPNWTQPFWTLMTGKALPDEAPLIRVHPLYMLLCTISYIIVGTSLQIAMLTAVTPTLVVAGYLLTPVFAISVTGAWRKLQVVYAHHAIHDTFFSRSRRFNNLIATILTILALVPNRQEYEREHFDHHRWSIFTTLEDADASLLYKFGLRPGSQIELLRRALWKALVSPRFHASFLFARVRSNLQRPFPANVAAVGWLGVLFVGLPLLFGLVPVALAVWLPMIVIYQMSALMQLATEHVWLLGPLTADRTEDYAARCHGRFCGERVPKDGVTPATFGAWVGWWGRTLTVHFPVRLCVLVGDLPAHDWHHLCGLLKHRQSGWTSAIYERQRAIDSGVSAGMETRELWGYGNMLTHVFYAMSCAPQLPQCTVANVAKAHQGAERRRCEAEKHLRWLGAARSVESMPLNNAPSEATGHAIQRRSRSRKPLDPRSRGIAKRVTAELRRQAKFDPADLDGGDFISVCLTGSLFVRRGPRHIVPVCVGILQMSSALAPRRRRARFRARHAVWEHLESKTVDLKFSLLKSRRVQV
jgi:hypothetical protein